MTDARREMFGYLAETAGVLASPSRIELLDLLAQGERSVEELPKRPEIVAYCRGPYCVMAYKAVEILRPVGYRARRLDGGFTEWRRAGLPLVRGETQPPALSR